MNGNEYTAKQAKRYAQTTSQAVKINCLWRIASNLDMFGADLNPDGTLTPQQQLEARFWIERNYGV